MALRGYGKRDLRLIAFTFTTSAGEEPTLSDDCEGILSVAMANDVYTVSGLGRFARVHGYSVYLSIDDQLDVTWDGDAGTVEIEGSDGLASATVSVMALVEL